MKEYEVSIVETLKKTVTVEAESPEDAKYQVQKAWGKGEYILDADDFSGLEFELSPYQVDMSYREMTDIFRAAERAKQSVNGFIVFTADSFEKPYEEISRTYGVSSNNKAFQDGMGGYTCNGKKIFKIPSKILAVLFCLFTMLASFGIGRLKPCSRRSRTKDADLFSASNNGRPYGRTNMHYTSKHRLLGTKGRLVRDSP